MPRRKGRPIFDVQFYIWNYEMCRFECITTDLDLQPMERIANDGMYCKRRRSDPMDV